MFGNLQSLPASLNDFSAYLWEEHQIEISKQGIDERFNGDAINFFKSLLSEQINNKIDLSTVQPLSTQFSKVRIKDSTKWNLPDEYSDKYKGHGGCRANSKSMISIQFEYNLLGGDIVDLSMRSGTRNDQQDSREIIDNIGKDDLLIRDLGYATIDYMDNIESNEAYFLNRMSPQVGVYQVEDKSVIDFLKVKNRLLKHNLPYLEEEVCIGSERYFKCRMIVTRVPEEVYQKRIEQAAKTAKKRGYKVTDTYKARAALNIFLTNATPKMLSANQVVDIYHIRWQIELMFKVWKSLAKVNVLSKMKICRFECQLLAKFIWLLINWKVFVAINAWMRNIDEEKICSIWKFYKQMARKPLQLRDVLWYGANLETWLYSLFSKARRNLMIEKRKGKLHLNELYSNFFA